MRIGSLFSGIGGLELGLERAGLGHVVWQCEIDPFCRAVLAKHWPDVTRFEDVTRPRSWPKVDLICGGFPCQDVSSAGKGRGIGGERSSLWWHFASVIEQVGPAWVVVENVASGASRWLHHVRHQLHVLGYRTRALGISASDVGAHHPRRRVFIVADADRAQREGDRRSVGAQEKEPHARDDGRAWPPSVSAWPAPPTLRRVDDGLSRRLDAARKRALGNAVVPQCAEVVGRVIAGLCTPHPIPETKKENDHGR